MSKTKTPIIVFGKGKIGVCSIDTNPPSIQLYNLTQPQEIGTPTTEEGKFIVQLFFETKEGLGVLMKALERCKAILEIPDEFKMAS